MGLRQGFGNNVLLVWLAMLPAMLWGMWNLGFQANTWLATHPDLLPAQSDWRYFYINLFGGHDPASVGDNLIHGAIYFFPLYVVTIVVSGFWEKLFALLRRQALNKGFFVTSLLFGLSLPPSLSLHEAALGISFGVVLANVVFGGTGKSFVNAALAGWAFLFFSFPAQMSGDSVWTAVDGFSGATALALAKQGGVDAITGAGITWWDCFIGKMQGTIGEVSTLCILLGAALLLFTRASSWRFMAGVTLSMIGMSVLFNIIGSHSNPMFSLPWHWHLVLGGFAFGVVFMASDPVSACMTEVGRWVFGILVGVLVMLIRVINPAYPEGVMLALLFANLLAGVIDHFVAQATINRGLAGNG